VWRTEPTRVENLGDELWVGVKGQSNSVIAGSPRNAFRCSVGSETAGDKLRSREGNSPDHQLRPLSVR